MGQRKDPVAMADLLGPDSTRREVADVLDRLRSEIDAVNARQEALWEARRLAYEAGRVIDDPLTMVELARLAGVAQPSVARALSSR